MFSSSTIRLISLGSLVVLPQALATVFMTSPTATTTCHGGQTCQVAWKEDDKNTPPLLTNWGTATISIYVGNQQQQTELQRIQSGVNVANIANINFTPDPTIGPSSNVYFIRFTSDSAKDPTNPTFPAESFSAKFALDNMSGTFNATVQAQISGATTAPIPNPTPSPSTNSSTTSHTSSTSTGTGTKSSSTTKPTSAASALTANSVGIVGGVAALFALML